MKNILDYILFLSTKLLTSVQRRACSNKLWDFRLPENLNRTREIPTSNFPTGWSWISGTVLSRHRYGNWPRPHHHRFPHQSVVIVVAVFDVHLLRFFTWRRTSLALLRLKHRQKRGHFPSATTTTGGVWLATVAVFGILVPDKSRPRPEKRNRQRPRAPERRLALDEIGHAPHGSDTDTVAAGESRKQRGGGGRRRRQRRCGTATAAGAYVSTFGTKSSEAFAKAHVADSAPPTPRGVFLAFPYLFFVDVERHFWHNF